MRLLFTTAPLRGHFFPLVPLAWAARAAGHEVLVATSDNFVPTVLQSGLPGVSCGPTVDFVDLVANCPDLVTGGVRERQYAHGLAFARIAARCLPGTRSLVEAWEPDLVVSERAEFAGPLAASVFDVPYVEYQWGVAPLDEYRAAAAAELAEALAATGRSSLPVPIEVLSPWPPGMRLPHAKAHQGVRAVAYNGAAHVPDWVLQAREGPRVCVTFGTVVPRMRAPRVQAIVVAIVEELAQLGVELLVAADEEVVASWPTMPPSVYHVGRLPLAQVLPTCSAVINHGGQGTVLTALVAGCPQLVLPQFDDQFDNADAVVRVGAGLSLPPDDVTPALVTERCRALLEDAGFARAAACVASEITAQPSPAEIVDLLEKLAV